MQGNARDLNDSKGFSLMELIIVMALIGIIMAIAMPSVLSQISHLRLTRSVRNVVSELNAARFKAIAQNKNYAVDFTINSGATPPDSYQLKSWNGAAYVNESGRAAGALETGISISSPGGPTYLISFTPGGTSVATSMCIENTHDTSDRMKITVTGSTGMIQVTTGC